LRDFCQAAAEFRSTLAPALTGTGRLRPLFLEKASLHPANMPTYTRSWHDQQRTGTRSRSKREKSSKRNREKRIWLERQYLHVIWWYSSVEM